MTPEDADAAIENTSRTSGSGMQPPLQRTDACADAGNPDVIVTVVLSVEQ